MAQNMQAELQKILDNNKLMGLTVATFDKNGTKTYNVGLQNFDTKKPISTETQFRIASISKAVASLGLMKLYDQKKFKLTDDVSKTLGFQLRNPAFPDDVITFEMIMSHTSSINDGDGYDGFLAATYNKVIPNISSVLLPEGENFSKNMWLDKKPGTFFTYCNLNFGILGTLIEKLSGQHFDLYMKNEILKPLGFSAGYSIQDVQNIDNLAVLYRTENNEWKPQKDNYKGIKPAPSDMTAYVAGTNGAYYGPQGGLRASANDLIKFLQFLKYDGKSMPKLISKRTLKKMKASHWIFDSKNGDDFDGFFKEYGLGLHQTNTAKQDAVADFKTFKKFIGHAGDAYGLISDAYFSEKQNFGFVIITNGCFTAFEKGKSTSFNKFEEEIIKLITNDFLKNKN
ncbi:MAG: FmtA-like protein [Bacteroidota bacterium]